MGALRLFLALSVIVLHTQSNIFGLQGVGGFYAVNVFFMISGFYMAMILTEKYRAPLPWVFYKSRALRLFPTYLVGAIAGAVISWEALRTTFLGLSLPGKIFMGFQNLFIWPQDLSNVLCVRTLNGTCAPAEALSSNPPSWTLAVELGFYALAPFVVRSPRRTVAYFLAGCVYLFSINFVHFPVAGVPFLAPTSFGELPYIYNFYASSFVFFAAGALGYQLSKGLARPIYLLASAGLILMAFGPATIVPFWQIPIFALAIPALFQLTRSNRFDRLIGELSFPVYVLHFPIIQFFKPKYDYHPALFGWLSLGTWVALASIAGAVVIHFSLERIVNAYRASPRFMRPAAAGGVGEVAAAAPTPRVLPKVLGIPYFAFPFLMVVVILISQA